MLAYAQTADGMIIHIDKYEAGLVSCPECDEFLVAKKGKIRRHHFAHKSNSECKSAPETALHKAAKQILMQEKALRLPSFETIVEGKLRKLTTERPRYEFYKCKIEEKRSDVRSDAVLTDKNERDLLVEIFVTHRVDESKLTKLREQGESAIEIDLSGIDRAVNESELRDLVVSSASRTWLFNVLGNSRESALLEALEKEQVRKRRKRENQIDNLFSVYSSAEINDATPIELPDLFRQHVLADLSQPSCFCVSQEVWRSEVLDQFIRQTNSGKQVDVKQILDHLKRLEMHKPELKYVEPALEEETKAKHPDFRSPYSALLDYVRYLEKSGVIYRSSSEICSLRKVF